VLSDVQIWINRTLLAAVVIGFALISLLPLGLTAEARVMPDLMFCTVFAWVVRQRVTAPTLLIGALALLTDILLMKPVGLWTFFVILATEYMRVTGRSLRDQMFVIEWLIFALIFAFGQLFYITMLNLTFTPAPSAGLVLQYIVITILIYPLIVAFLYYGLRIRGVRHVASQRLRVG